MGDGPRKTTVVDRVKRRQIGRVRFLGPRPHSEMPAILSAADVLIVPLLRYIPGAVPSPKGYAVPFGPNRLLVPMIDGSAVVVFVP